MDAEELLPDLVVRATLIAQDPRLVMPELLLVARRDEDFARFWQHADKDEADAPPAIRELIAGRGPVKVTEQEAQEALGWRDGRVGWIPTPGRLPFFGPYAVSVVTRAS